MQKKKVHVWHILLAAVFVCVRYILLAAVLIICIGWGYSRFSTSFVAEDTFIYCALKEHRQEFKVKSSGPRKDREGYYSYVLYSIDGGDGDRYIDICRQANEFLETHPEYFLNEGYRISLLFHGTSSGGPDIMSFANFLLDEEYQEVEYRPYFFFMNISDDAVYAGFRLEEIEDFSKYDEITAIGIDSWRVEDASVFQKFSNLTYLRIRVPVKGISAEEAENREEEIRSYYEELLPECEIDIRRSRER